MVDRTNLPKINALYGERASVQQAIKLFNEGGRIINLTVGKEGQTEGGKPFWQFTTSVSTETMTYPQTMVDAIWGFLHQRLEQITSELASLGVTGLEAA